jgi:hypothetical protein
MSSKSATRQVSPSHAPNGHPTKDSGAVGEVEQLPLFQRTVASLIEDLHAALGEAVKVYGGTFALAAAMEKNHGEVSLRVRRAPDNKGQVQKATFDLLAFVAADPNARLIFLTQLLTRWGYKAPEPASAPTAEEQLHALLAALDGVAGQSVKEAAARIGGFNPRSFGR